MRRYITKKQSLWQRTGGIAVKNLAGITAGCAAGIALTTAVFQAVGSPVQLIWGGSPSRTVHEKKVLRGWGYIRGRSATTLRNKYGSFVTKVHFYSGRRVKKGDCILEYDDFDLRKKIVSVENSIANLKGELASRETRLQLTKLDPLPSDYRNINWKTRRAKELLERTENEWRTYERLYKTKIVSELDLRSKKQAYQDARAAHQIAVSDHERVKSGLSRLYVRNAEEETALLKTKLAGLERELALLNEERKYYRIVTPYDGIIKTNSDTVHAWNNAGTAAACIHRIDRGWYVYAYFEEKDVIHLPDGTKGRFFSTDSGQWYDIRTFEVDKGRSAVGDGVYHLVKFNVLSPVGKGIRLEGNGVVEITL